jgi:Na+-translocating ferredoxin:NAD+ oxidoreductase RnfC subunit
MTKPSNDPRTSNAIHCIKCGAVSRDILCPACRELRKKEIDRVIRHG